MKARHRRTIFYSTLAALLMILLAFVIVPPFINLDGLKPRLENIIFSQTGIPAKINGHINMNFLGRTTVVAHNISVPDGKISSVLFSIPLGAIFNIKDATFTNEVLVSGARLDIQEITAPKFTRKIRLQNCDVTFLNKEYRITDAVLEKGNFRGTVRTNQHKYLVETERNNFQITNKDKELLITGIFKSAGGAIGQLSINTDDVNAWFDFQQPKIQEQVNMTFDFDWNGKYDFTFSNLRGKIANHDFTGNIELPESGIRKFQFASDDINVDLDFLLDKKSILENALLDLNLRGNIKTMNTVHKQMTARVINENGNLIIDYLSYDAAGGNSGSIAGEIMANGARNLRINFTAHGADMYCLFTGTTENWQCDEYSYSDKDLSATGALTFDGKFFNMTLLSNYAIPDNFDFVGKYDFFGTPGIVNFNFKDASGIITIKDRKQKINFSSVQNKSLEWLGADFDFLPISMRTTPGLMLWTGKDFSFTPNDKTWELTVQDNFFFISGASAKEFITAFYPDAQLYFANDFPYEMSGNYSKDNIKDLEIRIADHIFRGAVTGNNITLRTDILNLDILADDDYFDNYEEMKFLSNAPILSPFSLNNVALSLSASGIIWNGTQYDNFAYSVRNNIQDFSVTDDARGNLLVSIQKTGMTTYDILVRMNKFAFAGALLEAASALNISDSVITGQAVLTTGGKIAYDFWNNIKGTLEVGFDGGTLNGMGLDWLYANAKDMTRLNAEDMIANAITGGNTKINSLWVFGIYEDGNFQTTRKFEMNTKNSALSGNLQLTAGNLSAQMEILLRDASPDARPILLKVLPSGGRNYNMSEIMMSVDPNYMAEKLILGQ